MPYDSILNWIKFTDPMANPFYPYIKGGSAVYNLPYDIGHKLWELIGGAIAWLVNLLFPGNGVSTFLVGNDMFVNLISIVLMVVVIFAVGFIVNITMIWEERKILGRMMDRRATRIGPLGYLQNIADGLKTFLKEHITPAKADKKGYMWAVTILIGTSVLIACMIPLSDRWFIVDYGTGLLIIFGLFAIAPLMILVAGWSQNNKYSLIGGMRAAAQMVAYEVPILLVFASVSLLAGSFNINDIVHAQANSTWYIVPLFLGFIVFIVSAIAEAERIPFDLPEAEAELVEGWQTEYSGMKWGLIMLGDYFRGYIACALIVIMFLGGWYVPFISVEQQASWLPEIVFLLKVFLVFFVFAWVRAAHCRVRTDQILNIGWKVLMPLAVINLGITVAILLAGGILW
ncbi:MAG: NADH-quinone oxidoreductase subunit NuoH [Methanomassiliicoccaceae archaeon]|jgi:NADH-quinone oxidoreductase subunit H|nr:NADH-quinone oxidoreductase subunit NuoH [Methanomassiliicoccaceae archaeon]